MLAIRGLAAARPALRVRVPVLTRPQLSALRLRLLSTAPDAATADGKLVYSAPLGRSVRLMKGVSLTSCALTSIGMPTLTVLSEQSASMIGKWAMCGTIMLFGVGTTSLFHLLFKPYVLRMWLSPEGAADTRVTVETLTLLALPTRSSFLLSDVAKPEPSMHPMLSFQARGRNYFIHPECFEDDELLKKLLGADYKRPERVDKLEDDDE